MSNREPLYPHVPKGKKGFDPAILRGVLTPVHRGAGLYLDDSNPQTLMLRTKEGDVVAAFAPSTATIAEITRSANKYLATSFLAKKWSLPPTSEPKGRAPEFYYCANQELHPHREIIQIWTNEENPRCPYCHGVMTYGNYW